LTLLRPAYRAILTLAIAALAAAAAAAAAKYPPQLDREVIAEIQSRRYQPTNEPDDAKAIPWPTWRETRRRCNTGAWGVYLRAHAALLKDEVCSQLTDDVWKIVKMGGAQMFPFLVGGPLEQGLSQLEGSAAMTDVPDASYVCAARFLLYAYSDDPAFRAAWDKRVAGVANLKGLNDFKDNLEKARAGGIEALGDSDQERMGEAWDTAKSPGEIKGWLDSVVAAVESSDKTKKYGMVGRRNRAVDTLAHCDFAGALQAYEALRQESLEYLAAARTHQVWAEEQAYCYAPDLDPQQPPPSAKQLVASSSALSGLQEADARYREIFKWYVSIVNDPVLSRQGVDVKRQRIKKLMDSAADLQRNFEQRAACGGTLGDETRRLAVQLRDECGPDHASRLLAEADPTRILQRIDQLDAGRVAFSRALATARAGAEDALAQCRLGTALQALAGGLAAFDRSQAGSAISSATYRACFVPWPPDELERKISLRGDAIAAAERAAEAAIALARQGLESCDFAAARQHLVDASGQLAGAGCPQGAEGVDCERDPRNPGNPRDPEVCALARLSALVGALGDEVSAKEGRVGASIGDRESERRAAVASLEALTNQAEGGTPGRCTAIVRARGELARLPALARGPAECPNLGDPSLTDLAAGYADRLAAAERLGLDQLIRFREAAEAAAASCDAKALAQQRTALQGMPEICTADANAARQAIGDLQRRIDDDVRGLGERLGGVESSWGEAWNACDMARLGELRNSVAILVQDACVRALGPEARTRLDALRQMGDAVPRLTVRKATLDAKVSAKLAVAAGYVRLVEAGVAGLNTAAAAAGLHRKLDEAETVLREIALTDAELPEMCTDVWREPIEDLRRRIAAARSRIRADSTAEPPDPRIVEPERPSPGVDTSAGVGGVATEDAGSGWTAVGGVETISGGGGGPRPQGPLPPGPPPPGPDVDSAIRAATEAWARCQLQAALGHATRAQQMAPQNAWVAANLPIIAQRSRAQADSLGALAAARAAAARGDSGGALAALQQAAHDAPSCMAQSISDELGVAKAQVDRDRAAAREQTRIAFSDAFTQMIDIWNTAMPAAPAAGGGGPGAPVAREAACDASTKAGGDAPENVTVRVGSGAGSVRLSWEMYTVKDRMVFEYGGVVLLDTGCSGGSGSQSVQLAGWSDSVLVRVIPDCAGERDTQWNFTVGCPR
jgi:hypothetical protein